MKINLVSTFLADQAFVRFLIRMNPLMKSQPNSLWKWFFTNFTFKRFFTCVGPLMNLLAWAYILPVGGGGRNMVWGILRKNMASLDHMKKYVLMRWKTGIRSKKSYYWLKLKGILTFYLLLNDLRTFFSVWRRNILSVIHWEERCKEMKLENKKTEFLFENKISHLDKSSNALFAFILVIYISYERFYFVPCIQAYVNSKSFIKMHIYSNNSLKESSILATVLERFFRSKLLKWGVHLIICKVFLIHVWWLLYKK